MRPAIKMERAPMGTYTLRRIFPLVPESDLTHIQRNSSVIKVRKGQTLFLSGDSPKSIYCVASGCLKIVRETESGESVLLRIVRPGQIAGIREVIGGFKYARTSVALVEGEVFALSAEQVLEAIEKSPSISLQFMKIFCNELARFEKRIENDLCKPAKARVASVILDLYNTFAEPGDTTFELPLSRREIGELADVTPETVSRALSDFRQAGALETKGNTFFLNDAHELKSEAEED